MFVVLVGLALAPFIIALFLCWICCEALAFLMTGPFKESISRRFDVESIAIKFSKWEGLHFVVKWGAALVLSGVLIAGVNEVYFAKSLNTLELVLAGILAMPVVGVCAFLYGFMSWLTKITADPEVRRRAAGKRAEEEMRECIDLDIKDKFGGRTLHGSLLVFRAGTPNEFSVELDHVLVTRKNLYLVETKFKSGTIQAKDDEPEWAVETSHGVTYMRNALTQVKNSASVIRRELNLSIPVIPLVAIVGNDVNVVDGPSNVLAGERLLWAVEAFEQNSAANAVYQPDEIIGKLKAARMTDRAAFLKHVGRIDRKRQEREAERQKAEAARIVRSASLD